MYIGSKSPHDDRGEIEGIVLNSGETQRVFAEDVIMRDYYLIAFRSLNWIPLFIYRMLGIILLQIFYSLFFILTT